MFQAESAKWDSVRGRGAGHLPDLTVPTAGPLPPALNPAPEWHLHMMSLSLSRLGGVKYQ